MKFIVFSDSHNHTNAMDFAIEKHKNISHIIHCGDIAKDVEYLNMVYGNTHSICAVKGNNDYFDTEPSERLFPVDNQTIFCTHGHLYSVKNTLYSLKQAARERQASICIFGHTHTQFYENENGLILFNPGSIGYRKQEYAILSIESGKADVELLKL